MRKMVSGIVLLGALLIGVPVAWCGSPDEGWKTVGIRGGVSATQRSEFFHLYEAYASYGLPWSLRGSSGWGVALEAEGSVGALHGAKKTGVVGSLGPAVVIDKGGKGLMFKLGADLYGASRHSYGEVDLNGTLLFAGHVGLWYRFAGGPGIGYRFLHLSNGGLGIGGNTNTNTGVDFHLLDLTWNFH
jgi:hypothetical protein